MTVEELEKQFEKKTIRVGVVGSRRRDSDKDFNIIYSYGYALINKARKTNAELVFVSGGCKQGADRFIKSFCEHNNIRLIEHLPEIDEENFNYFDRVRAYYARNKLIAQDSHFLIAMVAPDRTGGTENTIMHAKNYNKRVVII